MNASTPKTEPSPPTQLRKEVSGGSQLKHSALFLILAIGTVAFSSPGLAAPATVLLYVSAVGNDAWSGALAAPNTTKTDGPFATLERARDEIRALTKVGALSGETTVFVRAGIYPLAQTLKLGPQDSGSADAPVVYRAYEGEKPVIIVGRQITSFQPHQGQVLKADVGVQGFKGVYFRQFIFNGERQHLARYPNFDPKNPYGGGWAYADGKRVQNWEEIPGENQHTLHYQVADARPWSRPTDGEVFVFPRYNYWNNIVRIKSVDAALRFITLAGDCTFPIRPGDRYYVQNLREELDAPGEWWLDRETATLYFWPPSPIENKPIYAPTLRTIVQLDPGVANITFRGFTLECCEGTAVVMANTTNCLIAGCTIRNVGDHNGSGVSINGGRGNGVVGCDIHDTGYHGVELGGGDRITLTPAENFADNNYIHHVGVFQKNGIGIDMSGCGNRASHNLIHDGPRMGIQFSGNNLVIEYNHIRHMNLETEDTGAIYTGGRDWISSRGSVVRYNFIHDILGYGQDAQGRWVSPHTAWGVYLDDNAGGVDVIGNIIARCPHAGILLHNGRDNQIENNVFVENLLAQVEYSGWTVKLRWPNHLPTMIKGYESVAKEPAWATMRNMKLHPTQAVLPDGTIMSGNALKRNIIAYRDPQPKLYGMSNVAFDHNEFDHNLVWHYGRPLITGQQKVKDSTGPNLAPNPGFEEGEPGGVPKDLRWQIRPNASQAVLDANVKFAGKQSLRISGGGPITDPKDAKILSLFVSADIVAKPGQSYRLTARIKAAEPDTKFTLRTMSCVDGVYYWAKETSTAAGTDWKDYELIFRFPGPGDRDWHEQMKSCLIMLDMHQPSGTLWMDDVTLREAVSMGEWESWQALGNDTHSLVADPLFVNAEQDDYRLKEDSPAFKLGFKPIAVEKIGPYRDPLRASWPIREAEGAREHPLVAEKP